MNFQFPGNKSATLPITNGAALAFDAWILQLFWNLGFGIWISSL